MIVTITLNPSVDRTILIDSLPRGTLVRARRAWSEPSGKGVNVSLALHAHGYATRAVLPIGGALGRRMAELLDAIGLDVVGIPIEAEIRSNVSLVEPDGTVTKINEPGPTMTRAEIDDLAAAASDAAARATAGPTATSPTAGATTAGTRAPVTADRSAADWVAICGSLPPGVPAALYPALVASARRAGARVAVDSSGPALAAALEAGPDLLKPNRDELEELTGRRIETLGDVVDAADDLRRRGVAAVLVSAGADGAILVDERGAIHGEAPIARPRSTVGAGDALLAGFLAAGGSGRVAMAVGLAWAADAVSRAGTTSTGPLPWDGSPRDSDAARVAIHEAVERDRRLRPTPA